MPSSITTSETSALDDIDPANKPKLLPTTLVPPLIVTKEEIDVVIKALDKALAEF